MKKGTALILLTFALAACQQGGEASSGTIQSTHQDSGVSSVHSEAHVHSYDGYKVDGNYHYQECTVCGEKTEKEYHRGGTASCTERARCEVCGAEYGELEEHQFGDWQFEEGEATHYRECALCHEKEQSSHSFVFRLEKDEYLVGEKTSDCESSNEYYLSCVCGAHSTSSDETFVVPNGHDYSLEIVLDNDANKISDATCTEPAQYGYVCSHDHSHYDHEHTFSVGEAKGHHPGELIPESRTFATCHTAYHLCPDCGRFFENVGTDENPVYEERAYDVIFDDANILYNDDAYGSEEQPYVLACKEDLYMLRTLVNGGTDVFEGKYFELSNDIDFNFGEDEYFGAPIGYSNNYSFAGNIDGNNHSIKGLKLYGRKAHAAGELPGDSLALFSRVNGASFKNLKLENVYVDGDSMRNAGLVSSATAVTIENVEVTGTIKGTTECAGIVGAISKTAGETIVKNCVNRATIELLTADYGCSAGILGATVNANEATILLENNKNYGEINADASAILAYAGGIVGLTRATAGSGSLTIRNCYNFGYIHAEKTSVGGIAGCLRAGQLIRCYESSVASVCAGADLSITPSALNGKDGSRNVGHIIGEITGNSPSYEYCCFCDGDGTPSHQLGDHQPLTDDATCQHEGHVGYWECSLCGDHGGEVTPQLEHDMQYVITEDTHQLHCVNCDEHEEAAAHTFVKDTERSVEPTTTEDGIYYYACSVCGYEKTVNVPYSCDHENMAHVEAKSSTCHEQGNIEYYHCPTCNHDFLDAEATQEVNHEDVVLALADHQFVKHDANINYTSGNVEYYTCSFEDHDATEGQYYVLEGDTYVAKSHDEIFNAAGSRGNDAYGTEENPYLISSVEDLLAFRDDVNFEMETIDGKATKIAGSNDTFSGKYVKLANDIDLTGVTFGNCIGNTDDGPFSGTFDGDNHTIKGFSKSGSDAIALFSRVTDGTLKNLNMEEVTVTTTTQRSSAFVGRLMGGTIDNCHVLSGTITGVKENGAIVGTTRSDCVIRNCSNRATITSTATGNGNGGIIGMSFDGTITIEDCVNYGSVTGKSDGTGGILGYAPKGPSAITIDRCVNYGAISGAGNGTGGVFGCHVDSTALVLIIRDCDNHGDVSGASHVGGIAGLPRASSMDSQINGCKNYGNVTGTGSMVGGIVSRARIDIINCGCENSVTLKVGSTIKTAAECADSGVGAPGYVCGSIDTSGNYHGTVSGCYRFDAE